MFKKKYINFQQFVRSQIPATRKKPISEEAFDQFIATIKTNSTHFYSGHTLKDTNITFEDFYLGKHYSGSKGPLCDREKILSYSRELFVKHQLHTSYRHGIIYKLIQANFICHHVAETLSYALGGQLQTGD